MKKRSLRKRFTMAIAIFSVLILALWALYHNIVYKSVGVAERQNAELTAENILSKIESELNQVKTAASVIASSKYVQDFLDSKTVEEFYEKAETVTEIIHKTAYPISSIDGVVTINQAGEFYRFTGGISNEACKTLYNTFKGAGLQYIALELDGIRYFCHSSPIFITSGQNLDRVGSVVLLTVLSRTRRILSDRTDIAGMEAVLSMDDMILLSSNLSLENKPLADLEKIYALTVNKEIDGTPLRVTAAIKSELLFPGDSMFIITSLALLVLLLALLWVLYRYLSSYFVKPMAAIISGVKNVGADMNGRLPELPLIGKPDFEELAATINDMLARNKNYSNALLEERQKLFDAEMNKQKMRLGLLSLQMDAHFIVNSLSSIRTLSLNSQSEKAAQMADGLAQLLKHQHDGEMLVNIFAELEMIEKYVSIMNIRFDNKFLVDYDVDDSLSECLMPGLVLQPIVENALVHGLHIKEHDARLLIRGFIDGGGVILEVSDNGIGLPPVALQNVHSSLAPMQTSDFPEPGLRGVALSNIQRRIQLRFGADYGIQISSMLGEGTTVAIKLPVTEEK